MPESVQSIFRLAGSVDQPSRSASALGRAACLRDAPSCQCGREHQISSPFGQASFHSFRHSSSRAGSAGARGSNLFSAPRSCYSGRRAGERAVRAFRSTSDQRRPRNSLAAIQSERPSRTKRAARHPVAASISRLISVGCRDVAPVSEFALLRFSRRLNVCRHIRASRLQHRFKLVSTLRAIGRSSSAKRSSRNFSTPRRSGARALVGPDAARCGDQCAADIAERGPLAGHLLHPSASTRLIHARPPRQP